MSAFNRSKMWRVGILRRLTVSSMTLSPFMKGLQDWA